MIKSKCMNMFTSFTFCGLNKLISTTLQSDTIALQKIINIVSSL